MDTYVDTGELGLTLMQSLKRSLKKKYLGLLTQMITLL